MRQSKFYSTLVFLFFVLVRLNGQNANDEIHATKNSLFHADGPGGMSDFWYSEAMDNIRKLEYGFYHQQSNTFHGVNIKNRMRFSVNSGGYCIQNITDRQNCRDWKIDINLESIGRPQGHKFIKPEFLAAGPTTSLKYYSDPLNVEYINDESGFRQNFELKKRPAGDGTLHILLKVNCDLQAQKQKGDQIFFYDEQDKIKLIYEDLRAWDANHTPLASKMAFNETRQTIELIVDDKDAVYPILVDPLSKTPEWSSSVDGVISTLLSQTQLQAALYGYTVTGLGDVNGDGYGDAAISAPSLVDIFSGTGSLSSVGAVFVFYGSPSGLSTVPAKTLQPNTAVAGALFGLSVDAGDVTGDGINDIIIGAPVDQISVNAGLGTVSGTVGKVYIYNGGAGALSNPTPFLTIQLSPAEISAANISINALFGFSVAVTEDLNNDSKKDIIVGSPNYAAIPGALNPLVQTGGAFVFLSGSGGNNFTTIKSLTPPTFSVLGITIPSINSISGLLFGYSVDGTGDYNGDGKSDVVVGAPAGVNLSGLGAILTGQVLGGQAYVYYGTANSNGISTSIGAALHASAGGLLGNAANLFGYKVKGVRGINMARNGNIVIGAPVGGLIPNTLGLTIQTGNVHVFKKKTSSPSGIVLADQVLESPKSTSLINVLNTLQLNLLFGAGIDNAYDINCDGLPDLVIGEPLSSGTNLLQLQASAVGGAAYVFIGDGTGGYVPTPYYNVQATYGSDFLSVNATALFGFSVAGVPRIKGIASAPRILVGSPSGALDFDNSVLNLGSTLGLLFDFTVGNNGLGKGYLFLISSCAEPGPLPVSLVDFKGAKLDQAVQLTWTALEEIDLRHYEVERSADGVHFELIGNITPRNSLQRSDYLLIDNNPLKGINYYRLRIVDKDGGSKYSSIISVVFAGQIEAIVGPNPVRDNFNIRLIGFEKGNYRIEVRNMSGQLQFAKQIHINENDHNEPMTKTNRMLPGFYYVNVCNEDYSKVKTVKVIVE